VIISGRVQGVWFRGWTKQKAATLKVRGWIRNRSDRTVEAIFAGKTADVDAMIELCRRGPPAARVSNVTVSNADAPDEPGFRNLSTV